MIVFIKPKTEREIKTHMKMLAVGGQSYNSKCPWVTGVPKNTSEEGEHGDISNEKLVAQAV